MLSSICGVNWECFYRIVLEAFQGDAHIGVVNQLMSKHIHEYKPWSPDFKKKRRRTKLVCKLQSADS